MPRRWILFGPKDPPTRRKPFLEKLAIGVIGGALGAATGGGLGAAAVGASIAGGAAAGAITSTVATLQHGGNAIEVSHNSAVHQAMQPKPEPAPAPAPAPAPPRPSTSSSSSEPAHTDTIAATNPMSAPTLVRTPAASHAPSSSASSSTTSTSGSNSASPSQHWDFNIASKRLCTITNHCTPAHSGVISTSRFENVGGFGPIPTGNYKITEAIDHAKMGLHALKLDAADEATAQKLKEMQRGGFYAHGPSTNPVKAFLELDSRGCIVVPDDVRQQMHVGDTIHVTP